MIKSVTVTSLTKASYGNNIYITAQGEDFKVDITCPSDSSAAQLLAQFGRTFAIEIDEVIDGAPRLTVVR